MRRSRRTWRSVREESPSWRDSSTRAQKDYNALMTARMIEISDTDMESAQKRIAKLIREVNRCITLLSEQ